MFSKIGDYLKTAPSARDTRPVKSEQERPKRDGTGAGEKTGADDDDMLFSIAAIRALMTTMDLPPEQQNHLQDILKGLDALEVQGIRNIPVRLGQSIYEAVTQALSGSKGR